MKNKLLITVLGLAVGSALVFGACSKKDNTETTQTTAAETSSETETGSESKSSVTAKINFELANHLEEGYDEVVAAFPEPASDEMKSESSERSLKYDNPAREFHLYDDLSGGYVLGAISAKAGDLFSLSGDSIALADLLTQVEGESESGLPENNVYLTVGDAGELNVVFQSEGYYFIVAVDKDDNISKDAAAAIVTEDRVAVEESSVAESVQEESTAEQTSAAN